MEKRTTERFSWLGRPPERKTLEDGKESADSSDRRFCFVFYNLMVFEHVWNVATRHAGRARGERSDLWMSRGRLG